MRTLIRPATTGRRRFALWLTAALVATISSSVGFVVATSLEDHDAFCTRCHTVPETTYYGRAHAALDGAAPEVRDLATAHYDLARRHEKPGFSCIACHRGDSSFGHRVATLALGARDTLVFIAGRADPTIEKSVVTQAWLPDAACVGCHGATLLTLAGLNNHFHTSLPQAARLLAGGATLTVSPPYENRREALLRVGLKTIDVSIACVSCHRGHATVNAGAATGFMEADTRRPVCISCHRAAERGPQDVAELD